MVGSSSTNQSSQQNMNYNAQPSQITSQVRNGDQFILLVKSHQSEDFKVWSSGDPQQTTQLFQQARRQVDQLTTA